jgi:hypothetical protein
LFRLREYAVTSVTEFSRLGTAGFVASAMRFVAERGVETLWKHNSRRALA